MLPKRVSFAIALAAVWLAWNVAGTQQAQAIELHRTPPAAFYKYYAADDGRSDGAYLSPRPTPPLVGHTYITYRPLMPHQFFYPHCQHYVQRDPCAGGCTKTTVVWTRDWLNLGFLSRPPRPVNAVPFCRKFGH